MPGCGKSTFADELAYMIGRAGRRVKVCSADDYFFDANGIFSFDANWLPEAHGQCREKFFRALKTRVDVVICNNTNLTMREYKHYLDTCLGHAADAFVVEFDCADNETAYQLCERSGNDMTYQHIDHRFEAYQSSRMQNPDLVLQPLMSEEDTEGEDFESAPSRNPSRSPSTSSRHQGTARNRSRSRSRSPRPRMNQRSRSRSRSPRQRMRQRE
jgi:hypothetical protein